MDQESPKEIEMKHIMTAIDGSEPSYRALLQAAELAKTLKAELSILIVREFVVGRKGVYAVMNDEDIRVIQKKAEENNKIAAQMTKDVMEKLLQMFKQ